jgi:hypothetical protein
MAMPATAKVESLIAGLLRLRGYGTLVLLDRRDVAVQEIFLAAVPNVKFVYLSREIENNEIAEAERAAVDLMTQGPNLQSVVELEIDGFRIGRNVQSIVLRQLRVGRLDDADPRHREATRSMLARSLAAKSFIVKLLDKCRPDLAVFVERGYTPAGEIFDGCVLHGVDTIQWCGAPQSDCLIYRRYNVETRGEHPLALSGDLWRRLCDRKLSAAEDQAVVTGIAKNYASGAWYNRQQLHEGKTVYSRDQTRQMLGLDTARKTAIVFAHILYDATFFYGDNLFDDYEHWLVETVGAAIRNPSLNWIVKVHPVNIWRSRMDGVRPIQLEDEALRKRFGRLPAHVKLMDADTPINTFSLFEIADYGLTVRGTIGMELPCFGIPVVTAGTGRYSGRGFTIDPATRQDYHDLLGKLQDVPPLGVEAVRRARLHYYGALSLRPVPMRSFDFDYHAGNKRGAASNYDVILRRPVDGGLLKSDDLGRLIKWLADEKSTELLSQEI